MLGLAIYEFGIVYKMYESRNESNMKMVKTERVPR